MEFTIKQSKLLEALSAVQGALEKKATIPVLSSVMIESLGEFSVRVTATDLDITIRRDAEAEITKPGAICINAQKLIEIVRNLPDVDLRFVREENSWVRMFAGKSKTRFAGHDRSQYPDLPQFKSTPITVPTVALRKLIERTSFIIKSGGNQNTIDGAQLEIENGRIRMVTLDKNRLGVADYTVESDGLLKCLIIRKALPEISKIESETVEVGEDQNHVFFNCPGQLITVRKLTVKFPNYAMVLPKNYGLLANFDAAEMKSAILRASSMSDEFLRTVHVVFKPGEIVITSQAKDEGETEEIVATDYKGEEVLFGFQWPFLVQFLNQSNGQASVWFKDSNSAIEISAEELKDYRYVVMPLNLNVGANRQAA